MAEPKKSSPTPRHSPAHRVEYGLARTLEAAVSALPERAADAVGRRVGRAVYGLGIRRKVVEENLRPAYEHLGRESAAILRLSKLDKQAIIDRTVPVGWDEMEGALSLGKGVMLV